MIGERLAVRSLARAGAIAMIKGYALDANLRLQIYPARPRSIAPPTAFVDGLSETLSGYVAGGGAQQVIIRVAVIVVHDLFDSKTAADQADDFVDGFRGWVADNPEAFDENMVNYSIAVEDLPAWVPEWVPPAEQKTYYASEITLEGFAGT